MGSVAERIEALSQKFGESGLKTTFVCSIVALLLVIVILYYIQIKRKRIEELGQVVNGMRVHILADSIIEACLQVLIVTIGAVLAIQFTSLYEAKKEESIVLSRLMYCSEDLVGQEDHMQRLIKLYQDGEINIDELQGDIIIEISLIENTLFRDDVIKLLPTISYSMLLSTYRAINQLKARIEGDENISSKTLLHYYNMISKDISYFKRATDLVVQYKLNKKISEDEFLKEMTILVSDMEDDPDLLS